VTEHEVLEKVRAGEVDFGLGSAVGASHDIASRSLTTDVFVAVMPPDHAFARARELSWRELKDVPLIGPPPGNAVREQLDAALAREGIQLKRQYEVMLPLTILGMVEAGLGMAVMTSAMSRLARSLGLTIKNVTGPVIQREMSLLFHTDRSLSPAAQNMRDLLLEKREELRQD
jgi:DNA-binding transcriptional LysR family regulator